MSNEREQKLIALANGVGADVKTIRNVIGAFVLSTLTVPGATSLISALNTHQSQIAALEAAPPSYTDAQANAVALALLDARQGTIATPSATQYATTQGVVDALNTQVDGLREEILGGAPEALNTLNELAQAFNNNPDVIANLTAALGSRVAVDQAQAFTPEQRRQGAENIGMGNPNHDFLADYVNARDAA